MTDMIRVLLAGTNYFVPAYLSLSLLFRIFLLYYSARPLLLWLPSLLAGLFNDLGIAFVISSVFFFIRRTKIPGRSRKLFFSFAWLFFFSLFFLFCVEYFFFEEFNSRFNSVAVDYLIYPTEVFVNIWESYNVLLISALCLIFSFLPSFLSLKYYYDVPAKTDKKLPSLFYFSAGFFFSLVSVVMPLNFTRDRIASEIAKNGPVSFFYSAYSHNLDYEAFYSVMETDKAFEKAREIIFLKNEKPSLNPARPVERLVFSKDAERKMNVMVFVLESFGSEFVGALGASPSYTPEFDAMSKEGLLFSNIFSTGNRTVRGLEAVLTGFPPLPAESIVKMKFSANIVSLPQLLKEKGYVNYFVYGGRGIFDNMKPFALRYGFDHFIEQKDFKNPSFKTIWGVCDEDIFEMSLLKARQAYLSGKPFFFLTLSVSNHKPYTYPEGRIPENPARKKRVYAVKYSDWALGNFFKKVKKEDFYKNTLFVFIADHGARVYGSQEIPVKSYRIPLLIAGPGITKGVNSVLGSSADLPSTIMQLLNFSYKSPFFGKSLLAPAIYRWVPLNHNRSCGYYDGEDLIVLGLNKRNSFYKKLEGLNMIAIDENKADREKKERAISIFQTAWETYKRGL